MRKLILVLLAVAGLIIGGSSPALAAGQKPVKFAYTYTFLDSFSDSCGSFGGCAVDASVDSDGNGSVCFSTFDPATGEFISGGCATVDPSTLVLSSTASVPATSVDLYDETGQTLVGTVTVSALDRPTGEKSYSAVSHGSSRFQGCRQHFSDRTVFTPVAGTLTIDGVGTFDESGVTGVDHSRELDKGCDFGF